MLQRVTDATFKPPLGECWHVSKVRALPTAAALFLSPSKDVDILVKNPTLNEGPKMPFSGGSSLGLIN